MRKRYKRKKRACAVCKPRKRGMTKRWSPKELDEIREWERRRSQREWND